MPPKKDQPSQLELARAGPSGTHSKPRRWYAKKLGLATAIVMVVLGIISIWTAIDDPANDFDGNGTRLIGTVFSIIAGGLLIFLELPHEDCNKAVPSLQNFMNRGLMWGVSCLPMFFHPILAWVTILQGLTALAFLNAWLNGEGRKLEMAMLLWCLSRGKKMASSRHLTVRTWFYFLHAVGTVLVLLCPFTPTFARAARDPLTYPGTWALVITIYGTAMWSYNKACGNPGFITLNSLVTRRAVNSISTEEDRVSKASSSPLPTSMLPDTKNPHPDPPPSEEEEGRGRRQGLASSYFQSRESDHPQFCSDCGFMPPLRANHCRKCNRCVARWDHHCAWTGACVGEKNHAFFLLFLWSESLLLFWATLEVLISISLPPEEDVGQTIWSFLQAWFIYNWAPILANLLLMALCWFPAVMGAVHTYMMVINHTSYETLGAAPYYLRNRPGGPYAYPFDRGLLANLTTFFGAPLMPHDSFITWTMLDTPSKTVLGITLRTLRTGCDAGAMRQRRNASLAQHNEEMNALRQAETV